MKISKKYMSNLGNTHNVVAMYEDGADSDKAKENPYLLVNKHVKNTTDMRRLLFCKDYMLKIYK